MFSSYCKFYLIFEHEYYLAVYRIILFSHEFHDKKKPKRKENTEKKYETAKYGVFKVGPDGDFVLVDLADKDLNKLTVVKPQ